MSERYKFHNQERIETIYQVADLVHNQTSRRLARLGTMKKTIIFIIFIPYFALSQSVDSLAKISHDVMIDRVIGRSGPGSPNGISITFLEGDTVFNMGSTFCLYWALAAMDNSKFNFDSLALEYFHWRISLEIPDGIFKGYCYAKIENNAYIKKLRKKSTQKLLNKYFDNDYWYNYKSKGIDDTFMYSLIVVLWERNIITVFDDYWGYLRIDTNLMNSPPELYKDNGERR
jgi:hypothetical protein